MTRAYLGLGSNLGDPEDNLRRALALLAFPALTILRSSQIYKTEPVGLLEQPWFLNLVAEIETTLLPLPLLHHCHAVEQNLGRKRLQVNGPRTIDIDILLYGSIIVSSEELTIPHPRYRDRRFTLMPLAELAPDLADPLTGETVAQMLLHSTSDSACYPSGTSS